MVNQRVKGGVVVKDVTPLSHLVEAVTPRPCSSHTLQLAEMSLQKPLKQNPVKPGGYCQEDETVFKRYYAINRLFLVPDLRNMQEFCWKKAYQARQRQ